MPEQYSTKPVDCFIRQNKEHYVNVHLQEERTIHSLDSIREKDIIEDICQEIEMEKQETPEFFERLREFLDF